MENNARHPIFVWFLILAFTSTNAGSANFIAGAPAAVRPPAPASSLGRVAPSDLRNPFPVAPREQDGGERIIRILNSAPGILFFEFGGSPRALFYDAGDIAS